MEKIEFLISTLETIRQHADPEIASWFEKACDQYMTSPARITFDQALGFKSRRGILSQRTRYQQAQRDHYLRLAMRSIDPDKKPTTRCNMLAAEIRACESRVFVNWKHTGGPPESCSELRLNIWKAKQTGQPLSCKWRTLFFVCFGY